MEVNITVVDVNDATPVFARAIYVAYLSEGAAPGDLVVQVTATDADQPGSPNAAVAYTMAGDDSRFAVDATTGRVTVADVGQGPSQSLFDYENTTGRVVRFHVVATDGGVPANRNTTEVVVFLTDVNDNPPIIDCDSLRTVVRLGESSVNGTFVARVIEGPYNTTSVVVNDDTPAVRDSLQFRIVGGLQGAMGIGSASGVSCKVVGCDSLSNSVGHVWIRLIHTHTHTHTHIVHTHLA